MECIEGAPLLLSGCTSTLFKTTTHENYENTQKGNDRRREGNFILSLSVKLSFEREHRKAKTSLRKWFILVNSRKLEDL